ncbi:MAG: hypothetical protein M3Q63_00705 [bacterium]|nr:hypothetical protein [bacterium]
MVMDVEVTVRNGDVVVILRPCASFPKQGELMLKDLDNRFKNDPMVKANGDERIFIIATQQV